MLMAEKPQDESKSRRMVDRDVIQIEFVIDDLVKQLVKDRFSPVANCNGCNSCSAAFEQPAHKGGR